ncbi:protein mono-ADP-ribosyltransferase PARP14-like [Branchiostoma floridae]|uniref:Protein mono-ADP-ribosyltransferase PARP14-like n=1 Tax=Branchiostoma floridae TaxID=7739 RepID=A0A9J7L0N1_BRAFL|nr:protein mono-ADP-ribosyltransferase PARP14-like [Branchiostoma floridae]
MEQEAGLSETVNLLAKGPPNADPPCSDFNQTATISSRSRDTHLSTHSRHDQDRLPRSSGVVGAVSRPNAPKQQQESSLPPTGTTVMKVEIVEGYAKLLLQHYGDVIREAEQSFSVRVRPASGGFSVSGTSEGASKAKFFLEEIAASVQTDVLQSFKPGMYQYLKEKEGREVLQSIEQDFRCVILVESVSGNEASPGKEGETAASNVEAAGNTVPVMYSCTPVPGQAELHIRDVIVQVQMGDITMEQVSAIVNPSQNNLDLDKGLSRAISMAAGPSVQKECRQYIRDNWYPKAGDVVATGAGNLPCAAILHLVQPTAKYLRSDVKNCLLVAHQMNLRSLVFPAVGTGRFHIKPERSARCMIDGIAEFVQDWSPTTLSIIRIVIFQETMLQAFHTAVHRKASENEGKVTPSKNTNHLSRLKNIASDKIKSMGKHQKHEPRCSTVPLPRPEPPRKANFEDEDFQPNEVLLHIFCLDQERLQNARKTVEDFLHQYTAVAVINDDKETGIAQLVKEEVKWLRFLGHEENVSISIEQEHCIRIEGSRNVTDIAAQVRLVLKTIVERRSRFARLMSSENYQWYYELPGEPCRSFQTTSNSRIETAFQANAAKCFCVEDSRPLVVDFSAMTLAVQTSNAVGEVRREDLAIYSDTVFPGRWGPQPMEPRTEKPKLCHLVTLDPLSTEFLSVQDKLFSSLGDMRAIVLRIERVQNQLLWMEYSVQRGRTNGNSPARAEETDLWYGTSAEACHMICLHGFNSHVTGHYDGGSQKGTAFTQDAVCATKDLCTPDYCGRKKVILAKVLVKERDSAGETAKREPYDRDVGNPQCDTFTCEVNPSLYVACNGAEAYPVYLISFKVF